MLTCSPPRSLQILSLARNLIKRIEGLDSVAETLEARAAPPQLSRQPRMTCATPLLGPTRPAALLQELWLSYNQIAQLTGLEKCSKLRVLYVANNKITDYKILDALTPLGSLEARAAAAAAGLAPRPGRPALRRGRGPHYPAGAAAGGEPALRSGQGGGAALRHRVQLPGGGAAPLPEAQKAGRHPGGDGGAGGGGRVSERAGGARLGAPCSVGLPPSIDAHRTACCPRT